MSNPIIKTSERIIPMVYAYSTPEVKSHDGWVKIGYTDKQDVEKRIWQQTHTADIKSVIEWKRNALFEDGSGESFHDSDFHRYLTNRGYERKTGTEWFHLDGPKSLAELNDFRQNHGILTSGSVYPYDLRPEQQKAVDKTVDYYRIHPKTGEFLWNAKPRFGKTLTTYDFAKTVDAKNVLILTNRPAIANSWLSDYNKFLGSESGYYFVSDTPALTKKKGVISALDYMHLKSSDPKAKCIEFVSLQDLKGSLYGGGKYDKLEEIYNTDWDLIVLDEAHEGTDTLKSEIAFDRMKPAFKLHLSGTPFKALANDKFGESQIFNWTYADEQKAKRDWNSDAENPYASMPQLNLFAYQMSEIIKDEISQGIDLNGETEEYAFDLNEFFATDKKTGEFIHEKDVDTFLDALTIREKFPFSTQELQNELKHTFWLLDRVDSAKALARKLEKHPVFKDYKIVLAAGDGKQSESEEVTLKKSYDRVRDAIDHYDKTITLSVGQLTTGVTIPEWTAVMMLSNVKSPALYMQTAFRAQNPYKFKENGQLFRKERAYVFDFDPSRTLLMYEDFANGLSTSTSGGKGSSEDHKENVRELLNFFPVIAEDKQGKMTELDAEKVLAIPRKIRAKEVVNRGFMSNFLFQNITNIFSAPKSVQDIINRFESVKEKDAAIDMDVTEDLYINEDGEVDIPHDVVAEHTEDLLGEKIYETTEAVVKDTTIILENQKQKDSEKAIKELAASIAQNVTGPLLVQAAEEYGSKIKTSTKKHLKTRLEGLAEKNLRKAQTNHNIDKVTIETEKKKALETVTTHEDKKAVETLYQKKQEEAEKKYQESVKKVADSFAREAAEEIVKTVETAAKEKESSELQSKVRDHLRGFSRTIPSFLMAYGTDENHLDRPITLENFDTIVPEDVFEEVTSISLKDFRLLRDGGEVLNEQTGQMEHFKGDLFDAAVFNESVIEFMRKKDQLSDYMKNDGDRDIFDYIPPQKNNQIFTPKWVVKKMVDELEEQDPGCFDDPNKTFIDLYMKSGLYPAEIVKRLFRSEKMKELYPNETERLQHIFAEQVFGLAPTEIIYKIATNFLLGFDYKGEIRKDNFRKVDSLELVKEGKLEEKLDKLFPE